MSETEGKRRTKRKKTESKDGKTFQQHRQKWKAQESLVLKNITLFNTLTQFFACAHNVYQTLGKFADVYSGTDIMNAPPHPHL